MRILSARSLEGPNIYSYSPVMKITVDIGKYEFCSTQKLPEFVDSLLESLPGLAEHECSKGYPGGFVERLREGTYLAHVFEHVALELESLAGCPVRFGKTRQTGRAGIYDVVYGYTVREIGFEAARQAERLIRSLLLGHQVEKSFFKTIMEQTAQKSTLGPSTQALVAAAKERHIPIYSLDGDSLYLFGYGYKQQRIWATLTTNTSAVAMDLAGHKELTNRLLSENGIPVPMGTVVRTAAEALRALPHFVGPVVLKPVDGNQGRGVTLNVQSQEEAKRAYEYAAAFNREVLMEEYIDGRQYRFCIVQGKMTAAAERLPAAVTGDGVHTVRELVTVENQNELRGDDHEKPLTKLRLDPIALTTLVRQGLTVQSIPEAGRLVVIRENANISSGGKAIDVTGKVHPAIVHLVERAARIVGLDVAGIDVVAKDISRPLWGQGAVIEVNAAPGLRMHHYPSGGEPRDVAGAILDSLFPKGDEGRIPIVAVTGTNGKTTVTRLVGHILSKQGVCVGMTSTDGIFIDGCCVKEGDMSGPASARIVLHDPAVEAAVLETARGGILRAGLAFDFCDVGVITNVTEDHLGQYGIEDLRDMAYMKSLVLERVKPSGTALINADDPNVVNLTPRVKAKVAYFSLRADNWVVRRYLGAGGKAFYVKDGIIYAAEGRRVQPVVAVADIPITLGGRAGHNVQNALIAVGVALSLNIPAEQVGQAVCSFASNPGRLTFREVKGVQVCIDYGHNPAGFTALLETVQKLSAKRLIGVIAAPGDRQDSCILSMGRSVGNGFDRVIIKEDDDLRGRRPGEVADLLRQGLLAAHMPPERIELVYNEAEAVRRALSLSQPGDMIVVFYERYRVVQSVLDEYEQSEKSVASVMPGGGTLPNDPAVAASGKTF